MVIIGAGIIGLSLAFFLVDKGKEVVILEKNKLLSGASGVNLGQISLMDREPKVHLEWAIENNEILKHLMNKPNFDFEYNQTGGILVLTNEEEKTAAKKLIDRQKSRGLDIDLIEGEDILEIEPNLNYQATKGVLYTSREGRLNPLKLTFQLAEKIVNKGGNILTETEVTDFKKQKGVINEVVTRKGIINAETVILATGAWTRQLGKKLGLQLPIDYHRGSVVVTSPVSSYIENVVVSAGFLIPGTFKEQVIGMALAQHENGSIIIGQASEKRAGYSREVSFSGIKGVANKVTNYFNILNEVNIIRSWSGNTPFTEDNLPIFGFSEKFENLFIAAGLKGAFSTALSAGKLAARMIKAGHNFSKIEVFTPKNKLRRNQCE